MEKASENGEFCGVEFVVGRNRGRNLALMMAET